MLTKIKMLLEDSLVEVCIICHLAWALFFFLFGVYGPVKLLWSCQAGQLIYSYFSGKAYFSK